MFVFTAILYIAFLNTPVAGFRIETNLTQEPLPDFSNWFVLKLADHSDREPNQPPSAWNNVTISLPYLSTGIQMTSVNPSKGTIAGTGKALPAEITFYAVDLLRGIMSFSVVWWGPPWILFTGLSSV